VAVPVNAVVAAERVGAAIGVDAVDLPIASVFVVCKERTTRGWNADTAVSHLHSVRSVRHFNERLRCDGGVLTNERTERTDADECRTDGDAEFFGIGVVYAAIENVPGTNPPVSCLVLLLLLMAWHSVLLWMHT